jgi:hypothetical protein
MAKSQFQPMGATHLGELVDRTYRESHDFQWAREAAINSKEAGATRVIFGVEWQGVERKGVYRRIILDDGWGMSPDDAPLFMNRFGGSGKPIGGVHENWGHGVKTSTLPWNRNGIVVITKTVDGGTSMMRLGYNENSNEYGIRTELDENGFHLAVYEPYDDEDDGINYSDVIPEEYEHGTAIILFGSPQQPDSILGAYDRAAESDNNGLVRYLNERIWDLEGLKIRVDIFNHTNKKQWPRNANDREIPNTSTQKWQTRTIRGAKNHIVSDFRDSSLEASGTVQIANGAAEVQWYLRRGTPTQTTSVARYRGYIAYLYRNELYSLSNHPSSFRSFGIPAWMKDLVFLIVKPGEYDDKSKQGVYSNDARTQLMLAPMGREGVRTLPISDWANDFAQHLPAEISEKITAHFAAQASSTIRDKSWAQRLADRFGALWRIEKLFANKNGQQSVKTVQPVKQGGTNTGDGPPRGPRLKPSLKTHELTGFGQDVPAKPRKVFGGLPEYRPARAEDFDEPWILASWERPNPTNEMKGEVLINTEHAVIRKHIFEVQSRFTDEYSEKIADEVIGVYGELACAHIAHSESLKSVMPNRDLVDEKLRSDGALTMALLGMWQVEAILMPRLSGYMVKRKSA